MAILSGGCHCGNLVLSFSTRIAVEQLEVRECQCTFCRSHASRNASDPNGSVEIVAKDRELLSRYQFGLRTSEFLLCRRCGVYVAAVMTDGDQSWATINVNAMSDRDRFQPTAAPVHYDEEDAAMRIARRKSKWTPAVLRIE